MTMYKIICLLFTSLMLISCQNSTTYNEAELIRKLDSLQLTVSQLNQQVQSLQKELNEYVDKEEASGAQLPATATTSAIITSKITNKAPAKTTKGPTSTTKPIDSTTPNDTSTSPVFVREDFDRQMNDFRQLIAELSATIASVQPDEDEVKRFDQFYVYQEEIRSLEDHIKLYQTAMKTSYDNQQLAQEEFIEKERQVSKLNDALMALEDQLEVRFGMNDA